MLVPGTRVTTAVDVYSFGIMMWEFYTSKAPYAGLTREGIMERVLHRGGRPAFPSGAPRTYVELATACWAASPADRPSFDDIVGRLQEMAGNIEAAVAGAAGAAGAPA
jgi:serine/threonine protein kinase